MSYVDLPKVLAHKSDSMMTEDAKSRWARPKITWREVVLENLQYLGINVDFAKIIT